MSLPAAPYLVLPHTVLGTASLWAWASTLGMHIGVKNKEPLTVMRLSNILLVAITVFPPVYYPATLLPEGARMPAFLLPTVAVSHLIAGGPAMRHP
ncbi:MAG TPA: hypothetical protein EYP33_03440 [Pyrodictium sp.]|nr:hypothetical protein [Pyrodictium sp.]